MNIITKSNIYCNFSEEKCYHLYLFSAAKKQRHLIFINNSDRISYEKVSSIICPTTSLFPSYYSINSILNSLYIQKLNYTSTHLACKSSHFLIFNTIVESLLKQYLKHGIDIPSLHFEIIATKMTAFVRINYPAESTLATSDIIEAHKVHLLDSTMKLLRYKNILYTPVILGITKSVLAQSGALSSLSFQETFKHLINLSLESKVD